MRVLFPIVILAAIVLAITVRRSEDRATPAVPLRVVRGAAPMPLPTIVSMADRQATSDIARAITTAFPAAGAADLRCDAAMCELGLVPRADRPALVDPAIADGGLDALLHARGYRPAGPMVIEMVGGAVVGYRQPLRRIARTPIAAR